MKKEIIATQIRIPLPLYSNIKKEANELGVSINSHMIELMDLGIRFREADILFKSTPQQYQ